MTIGRKQRTDNDKWLATVAEIGNLVSRAELDALTESTLREIQDRTAGKKNAYAWSGGKDSIVLADLCEQAGIHNSMIGVCDLEYPAFTQWIEANKPMGCEIINTGQNIEWLAKHPDMLFPKDHKVAGHWFQIVQHAAQARYFREHGMEILILGRRRADGNFVGRGTNQYTDRRGVTRYSPLASWTHEQVLAYIHYHQLPLPPIYSWQNGYLCGTHPWPARQWTGDIENGWHEVYAIDPGIVIAAAEKIESAQRFLDKREALA